MADKIKTTTETQRLKVALTQEEILEHAQKLTDQLMELAEIVDEAKSVAQTYKAKLTALESQVVVARNLVHNKYEIRAVECTNVLNYTTGRATTVRTDTGEIVMQRAMTYDERQSSLPFDDEKDAPNDDSYDNPCADDPAAAAALEKADKKARRGQ
jgi:hypothetical protein